MKITIFTKAIKALKNSNVLIERLKEKGLSIEDKEIMFLTKEQSDVHYAHIKDKPFYGEVVKMFQSSPSLFLLVEGELETVLEVVGKDTDPLKCVKDTYLTWNACHRSSTEEDALDEYERFWGENGFITKFRMNPEERLKVEKFL